jgi:hypothetical protein
MSSATAPKASLVGRPLVPFFDEEENVNDRLVLRNQEHECMDVDARVWNKELGYFVYPNDESQKEQTRSDLINRANKNSKQNNKKKTGGNERQVSAPTAIKSNNKLKGKTTDDLVTTPKQLLTPSMLSSSAPDDPTHLSLDRSSKNEGEQRSKSRKRGSKTQAPPNYQQQKSNGNTSRSSTPQRTKKENNTSNTIDPSVHIGVIVGGVGGTAQENKKGKNKKNQSKQDLSKSGKWAWSAFQSSPDPKALPLPPFLDSPQTSGGAPSTNEVTALPTPLPLPPSPPTSHPLPPPSPVEYPTEREPPLPPMPPADGSANGGGATLEEWMTQDLRLMLKIGNRNNVIALES